VCFLLWDRIFSQFLYAMFCNTFSVVFLYVLRWIAKRLQDCHLGIFKKKSLRLMIKVVLSTDMVNKR